MRTLARSRAFQRLLPVALLACVLLSGAAPTSASAFAPAPADDDDAAWVGRYCTPQGCSGSLESVLGNAAGFGAAALAAVLLARRRSA
ncbi:MAG: hypothetical protein MUF70_09585 [Myxococcota bacterium]|jgi:hypothetical protein|nr:hypothetical protein [Myxococcota bacterium]